MFTRFHLTKNRIRKIWLSVKAGMGNRGTEREECGNGGGNAGNRSENAGNQGGNAGNGGGNMGNLGGNEGNRDRNAGNRIEIEKTETKVYKIQFSFC